MAFDCEYNLPAAAVSASMALSGWFGEVVLPSVEMLGTADIPVVFAGSFLLKPVEVSGKFGWVAAVDAPAVQMSGTMLSQSPMSGQYVLPSAEVSGAMNVPYICAGGYVLPAAVAAGDLDIGVTLTGQYGLPAVQMDGVFGLEGEGVWEGEITMPSAVIQGEALIQAASYIIEYRRY